MKHFAVEHFHMPKIEDFLALCTEQRFCSPHPFRVGSQESLILEDTCKSPICCAQNQRFCRIVYGSTTFMMADKESGFNIPGIAVSV